MKYLYSVPSNRRFNLAYYRSGKVAATTTPAGNIASSHTTSSPSFARPTITHHGAKIIEQYFPNVDLVPEPKCFFLIRAETAVTSMPPSAVTGFLAPPPPPISSIRGLNKPSDIVSTPNRLQQSSSIGMTHPTFRSDYNKHIFRV